MNLIRLDISLDGDEETNAKIRLHKDGFKKSLETIERLKKIKGVVLRVQFTIYKENLHLIEWNYNFAKKVLFFLLLIFLGVHYEHFFCFLTFFTQNNALSLEKCYT